MELGSGVGVTGFAMGTIIKTTLSDYMLSLLENQQYNLWMNTDSPEDKREQFETDDEYQHFSSCCSVLKQNVSITYLNWFAPLSRDIPVQDWEGLKLLPPF